MVLYSSCGFLGINKKTATKRDIENNLIHLRGGTSHGSESNAEGRLEDGTYLQYPLIQDKEQKRMVGTNDYIAFAGLSHFCNRVANSQLCDQLSALNTNKVKQACEKSEEADTCLFMTMYSAKEKADKMLWCHQNQREKSMTDSNNVTVDCALLREHAAVFHQSNEECASQNSENCSIKRVQYFIDS